MGDAILLIISLIINLVLLWVVITMAAEEK